MKRVLLLVFVLTACCAAQDVGSVTIFRLSDHQRGWKPIVSCDGQRVAAMQGGKYATILVSAGRHTFTTNHIKNGIELDVKPAGEYFLRVTGTNSPFSGKSDFEIADAQQTRTQMIKMEPLKAEEIAGGVCRNRPAGQ